MDFLGIGLPELLAISVIILLILGPKDMVKTGKTIGNLFRKITLSDEWKGLKKISREVRTLPNRLAREAQLEELKKQIDLDQQIAPVDKLLKSKSELGIEAWTQKPSQINEISKSEDKDSEPEVPKNLDA